MTAINQRRREKKHEKTQDEHRIEDALAKYEEKLEIREKLDAATTAKPTSMTVAALKSQTFANGEGQAADGKESKKTSLLNVSTT